MSRIEQVVAIGGLGGSGTRLMARLMQEAGLAMGERLNRSLDDLWFSGLFKRPGSDLPLLPTEIQSRYSLFRKLREHERLGLGEFIQLRVEMRYEKDSRIFNDPPWKCLFQSDERPIRWGWKEPNTHLFLKTLLKEESRLRYIHLIRDGRYMAFSANQQQYKNWRHLYELDSGLAVPLQRLHFWVKVNMQIKELADEMPDKIRIIQYEELLSRPEVVMESLFKWLKWEVDHTALLESVNLEDSKSHTKAIDIPEALCTDIQRLGYSCN